MIEPDFLHTTRTGYNSVAVQYAELFANKLEDRPLDRAMLAAFADIVRADGAGPVADIGCGPGHVTALLHSLGLSAFGVDLSTEMLAIARKAHPDLRFDEGSMTALPLGDGELGGILARYSIIHTPPERLPEVFAEFHRVLASGGHLLLAFPAHDDPSEPAKAFDHKVALAHCWSPDGVAGLLRDTGLVEVARLVQEPEENDERGFQGAHLLARKGRPAAFRPPLVKRRKHSV
ncbi:class I SAM-dependent methyltransferase [Streptomyces sp. HC44]|uniref:Class I SAM-dependent methyltransferase n=1 Tax=Streptomyces scabichelini TaxID=2711217 RepID=A0A6G4V9B4_9ACTN|nr:class I SAM-dependent methyltransferase [Streptomyces scabichelini]NGO10403.1 class I SAM-dependent methyltransferase [Streptomyces scabichelini]